MLTITRRDFLRTAAAGLAALPLWARASSPNGRLRTAHIGVGGMGRGDLDSVAGHRDVEVVALCDVDANHLAAAAKDFPKAETFADFRALFDRMADRLDAVVVSTPDHTHAPAAMTALNHGKHVYCQKPLTHEVHEARRLREVAAEKDLVTQMGIQVHASVPYRRATRMIQDGVIGRVREVHAWSAKDWGHDGPAPQGSDPVPAHLDWDLWLGTAAERPFKQGLYHPANWRRLVDFGTGTLGDMGVHIFDTPYRALKLTAPRWARTTCRPPTGFGHPARNTVEYEFPGTEFTADALRWVWYDGASAPPREHDFPLSEGQQLPDQGAIFLGERGALLLPHVAEPQLLGGDFGGHRPPEIDPLDQYHQWVDACLGRTKTSAHFGYAGPLTEALLLGVVANRFPGERLEWDAEGMKVTNLDEANRLIRRDYREGFSVENL